MNLQCHILHPDHPRIPHGFRKMAESVLSSIGETHDRMTIILCNDTLIRRLNRKFLNQDCVTDVISFDLSTTEMDARHGEIYVNLDQVRVQANQFDVIFWNELVRLTIHGILHFYGYDDNTNNANKLMMKRQEELVQKYQGNLHW
jgi:rRNA maturation RNase YbeY